MKKLFLALLICLAMVSFVQADVTFHNTNQATVAWEAVTVDVDGDPLEGVKYNIYIANATTDPGKTNPIVVSDITETTYVVTLSKGKFFIGVSAIYQGVESVVNWADVESEYQVGIDPWGLCFLAAPKAPMNFKVK